MNETTFEQAYQPRYVAYAEAHGNSPADQLEVDEERYPGGCMVGFILWSGHRMSEWYSLTGRSSYQALTKAEQDEYTAWLQRGEAA